MTRVTLLIALFSPFLLFFGCQQNADTNEQSEILDPNNQSQPADEELSSKLGYVRYTKEEVSVEPEMREIIINREQTADTITRTILQTGNFNEVATLVTDKEIVIAYEKNNELNDQEADQIAEKTAQSILPSFYDIYTTSNPYHMDEIHSLHNETTNDANNHQVIEEIINNIDEDIRDPNRR